MKALVATPSASQVTKGRIGSACQDQYFHPDQLAFPSFQLCRRIGHGEHASRQSFFIAMPRRRFSTIKAFFQVSNQWHFFFSIVRKKRNAFGQDRVINGNTSRFRRTIKYVDKGKGCFHAFQGLEMGLAHAIKVALGLFFTAIDLASPRFGAVALTETLRLDNARASFKPTVTTFVFQISDGLVRGRNGGCLSRSRGKLGARCHGQKKLLEVTEVWWLLWRRKKEERCGGILVLSLAL